MYRTIEQNEDAVGWHAAATAIIRWRAEKRKYWRGKLAVELVLLYAWSGWVVAMRQRHNRLADELQSQIDWVIRHGNLSFDRFLDIVKSAENMAGLR